jgi:hypothetical protein
VFRSRKLDIHQASVQAFFGALPVQLRVLTAHVERNHLARDETALAGGFKLGRNSGHLGTRYKTVL